MSETVPGLPGGIRAALLFLIGAFWALEGEPWIGLGCAVVGGAVVFHAARMGRANPPR